MSLAIETHQLTRYFDDFCAVDDIELRVERGTFYGFLGPNGAGKSTTIKMLTGLLAPSRGKVLVLGKNMLDPREALEAKGRVGVIPEDLALFDNLTGRCNPYVVNSVIDSSHPNPTFTACQGRAFTSRIRLIGQK